MSWMVGTSTIGSISFGIDFVTGRNRVPSPATGRTALRTLRCVCAIAAPADILGVPRPNHTENLRHRLVELGRNLVADGEGRQRSGGRRVVEHGNARRAGRVLE